MDCPWHCRSRVCVGRFGSSEAEPFPAQGSGSCRVSVLHCWAGTPAARGTPHLPARRSGAGNGTIRTSTSHGSLILGAETLQSAQLLGCDRGGVRPPATRSALGRFPGWPVLCTGWAVGLLREGGPEPHCTAQGLARAPYFSAVLFCGNGIRSSVCWSNGQHPPHARDRTCSPFRKSSFCPQIPIGINISWLLK